MTKEVHRRIKEIRERLDLADEFKDNWEQLVLEDFPWVLQELKRCLAISGFSDEQIHDEAVRRRYELVK